MSVEDLREDAAPPSPARAARAILLIRLPVGLIFLTQGILKYIDRKMGVLRLDPGHGWR